MHPAQGNYMGMVSESFQSVAVITFYTVKATVSLSPHILSFSHDLRCQRQMVPKSLPQTCFFMLSPGEKDGTRNQGPEQRRNLLNRASKGKGEVDNAEWGS